MKSSWPAVRSVLQLLALLFSNRWIKQWEKQWTEQHPRSAPAQRQGPGPTKRSKKKAQPDRGQRSGFYERIFSLRVTLWYLLYQRLTFDTTLSGVVRSLRNGEADRLSPRGKPKLSGCIRSAHTSSYNDARQRLPLALLQAALKYAGQKIQALVGWSSASRKPGPLQRPRQLLDGSTLAMLSNPELAQEYPPARVRTRTSDWCLMRVVVGFCARSGAVLSAQEGPTKQSEQRLAWRIMAQADRGVIWIADRNFGVWSVVAQAQRFEQDALVRLTASRARRLMGGKPLYSGEDRLIEWSPTRHDQSDEGTKRQAISGRLIYVRLKRGHQWIDLYLFTTLTDAQSCPVELLVRWYGQRWQAELHFRSVKTQLRLYVLNVQGPEMARKEFYAALLAYNLVRAVMWKAGENLETGQQTLSFNNARRVVVDWLENWGRNIKGAGNLPHWIQTLIDEVRMHRLPKRKQARPNQPRKARSRPKQWPRLKGSRRDAQKRYAA